MDYLAWAILATAYVLAIVPIIGNVMGSGYDGYLVSMTVGLALHAFLLVGGGAVFAVLWAFSVVLN